MWWQDPQLPWNVKAARARRHIDDLADAARKFLAGGTFNIVSERQSEEMIFRLEMSEPIPAHFSAIIGDGLHNLRSALDCAAYEMASRHAGRPLTTQEEKATAFPIYPESAGLDGFFREKSRTHLYSPEQQNAIRAVQPGHLYDSQESRVGATLLNRQREVDYDLLFLLNKLSNIDKHRRLHTAICWPSLIYWASSDPAEHKWTWGNPPFITGAILGRLTIDPGSPEPPPDLHHEFEMRLTEPIGASNSDVAKAAGQHVYAHNYICPASHTRRCFLGRDDHRKAYGEANVLVIRPRCAGTSPTPPPRTRLACRPRPLPWHNLPRRRRTQIQILSRADRN
jgi:hypothetical protein